MKRFLIMSFVLLCATSASAYDQNVVHPNMTGEAFSPRT